MSDNSAVFVPRSEIEPAIKTQVRGGGSVPFVILSTMSLLSTSSGEGAFEKRQPLISLFYPSHLNGVLFNRNGSAEGTVSSAKGFYSCSESLFVERWQPISERDEFRRLPNVRICGAVAHLGSSSNTKN